MNLRRDKRLVVGLTAFTLWKLSVSGGNFSLKKLNIFSRGSHVLELEIVVIMMTVASWLELRMGTVKIFTVDGVGGCVAQQCCGPSIWRGMGNSHDCTFFTNVDVQWIIALQC